MSTALRLRLVPLGVSVPLAAGERVLDALDEAWPGAGLPTACRAGNCGACVVAVERGGGLLEAASARELETLRALGATRDQRLGCQLRARAGLTGDPPELVLRVIRASGVSERA